MGLPNKGMLLVGAPLAYKQNPQNVVDGQFSGPFVVACGLATGHMGWDSYALLHRPDRPRPPAAGRLRGGPGDPGAVPDLHGRAS